MQHIFCLRLSLLLAIFCSVEGYKNYTNYKIYAVDARTEQQQQLLTALVSERGYDFLSNNQRKLGTSRILVPPFKFDAFTTELTKHGIHHTLLVDNVEEMLAQQRFENGVRNNITIGNIFDRFYQHDEINAYLGSLSQKYPTRVFLKTFGFTHERRPLVVATITNGDGRAGKHVIFMDGAIHAREWITPAMALHTINELVLNHTQHEELLRDYDWVILPVVNADGYEYTHTEDRYWRKTRRNSDPTGKCIGTDANRNFGFQWGLHEGSSADPCDETYRGDKPFSEPEAQVVRDIMWTYGERMKFYLSLHSYGNYLLLPWGYTSDIPDNFWEMLDVAEAGAMAIVIATGSIYSYGNTHSMMYATSGDSADYAAGALGTPVTIAMELPAGGFSGFDPPPRQIEDLVTETWIGVKAMAEVVVRKLRLK